MTTLWEAARRYLDVPWRDSGRSSVGTDCVGLVLCAARDIGVDMDPKREVNRRTPPAALRRAITRYAKLVPVAEAAPGDIVLFQVGRALQVGILTPGEPLGLIHALIRRKVVEVPFKADRFPIRGVFRLS